MPPVPGSGGEEAVEPVPRRVAVPKPRRAGPGRSPAAAAQGAPWPVCRSLPRRRPRSPRQGGAKKKGRSKLVLLAGAVIVLAAWPTRRPVMKPLDVRQGTTVLGVRHRRRSSKEQAVQKLGRQDSATGRTRR
ncbi:hypothetical protein [Streptomyces thioluteus]|uniref:hypothetical protein n=1 Tax=Streptomyces thioluteus TaxID=66431 RepID=UPI0031EA4AC2